MTSVTNEGNAFCEFFISGNARFCRKEKLENALTERDTSCKSYHLDLSIGVLQNVSHAIIVVENGEAAFCLKSIIVIENGE